jgi:hypothetical protein
VPTVIGSTLSLPQKLLSATKNTREVLSFNQQVAIPAAL